MISHKKNWKFNIVNKQLISRKKEYIIIMHMCVLDVVFRYLVKLEWPWKRLVLTISLHFEWMVLLLLWRNGFQHWIPPEEKVQNDGYAMRRVRSEKNQAGHLLIGCHIIHFNVFFKSNSYILRQWHLYCWRFVWDLKNFWRFWAISGKNKIW